MLVLGGTSVGGNGIDMAIVARDVFGFKIKIVSGYKTSAETKIALERGEIDGTFANLWTSLKQTDWLAKGLVRVIVQHGTQKHPELPTAPLFRDFASGDAERQMLEVWACAKRSPGPIWRRPDFPERLALLRRAFDATVRDPAISPTWRASNWRSPSPRTARSSRPWSSGSPRRRLPWCSGWSRCSPTTRMGVEGAPRAAHEQADHSPRVTHLSHRGGS